MPPLIRVDGDIRRINVSEVGHKEFYTLIYEIMSDKQRKDYEEFLETGFSIEIPTLSAFVQMPLCRIVVRLQFFVLSPLRF